MHIKIGYKFMPIKIMMSLFGREIISSKTPDALCLRISLEANVDKYIKISMKQRPTTT